MFSAVVPTRHTPLPLHGAIEQVARLQANLDAENFARRKVEEPPPKRVTEPQAAERSNQRSRNAPGAPLDAEAQARLAEMRARDQKVRDQEAAQARAAAPYAGATRYEFETGPDGRRYAVSGETKLDVSAPRGDAEDIARKMEQLQAAALAADDLSVEDRRVLAEARKQRLEAQTDIITGNAERRAEAVADDENADAKKEVRDEAKDYGEAAKQRADAVRERAEQGYAETQNLARQQVFVNQIDIAA